MKLMLLCYFTSHSLGFGYGSCCAVMPAEVIHASAKTNRSFFILSIVIGWLNVQI